jgi:predicted aspartyl protease
VKFNYRRINLDDPFTNKRYILRPIILISLKHKMNALRFEALIDSGADFSIFPIEIANKLKIPLKKTKRIYFSGVGGGSFEGIITKIVLEVGAVSVNTKAVFTNAKENIGILGQKGFFDQFDVKLSYQKQQIEIERV